MARSILLHVNVTARDDDPRTAGEIAEKVAAMIEVGNADPFDTLPALDIVIPLAEEV
jgi:hypothetical protein